MKPNETLGPRFRAGTPPPGLSYALEVKPSVEAQGAGNGLIIKGSARAGDLIAFYPGTVYRPTEVLSVLSSRLAPKVQSACIHNYVHDVAASINKKLLTP